MKTGDPGDETALTRVCAALIAGPVLELSVLATVWAWGGRIAVYHFLRAVPFWLHVAYFLVAAIVGLLAGFRGLTWIVGHLFRTHAPDERSWSVTVMLWGAYAGLCALGYAALKP